MFELAPIKPGEVGMYVCGVTVYDMCHIGHARAYVTADVIYRHLKYRGYDVGLRAARALRTAPR